MSYVLSKLPFGTGQLEKLFEINTEFAIHSMCHVADLGFLFPIRDQHFIGFTDYKGVAQFPWAGEIGKCRGEERDSSLLCYPSSVCYHPITRRCYVIENGGLGVQSIDTLTRYCQPESMPDEFIKYFSKVNDYNNFTTSCDTDGFGSLYWTVKELHRCFMMRGKDNIVVNFMGSGISGFSNSHNLNHCYLSNPSGVRCIKNSIYIADSGNHCVRDVTDGIAHVTLGNPLSSETLVSPSQIRYNSKVVYVLDQQNVKYFSLNDKNTGVIYTSQNIVAIETGLKKELYVLERV